MKIFDSAKKFSIPFFRKKTGTSLDCYALRPTLIALCFTLFLLLPTLLFAQAPDTLWTKKYGGNSLDVGVSVQELSEGGYIICGYTASFGSGRSDVYLIKTDENGDSLWTKTYGGLGNDWGWWVEQTTDTGYIIAGYTNSFGAGNYDIYLIKTDSFGDTTWTKTIGGDGRDFARSVQQTFEGGYIICGASSSFNPGIDADLYLIKTDSMGDIIWKKTYGGTDEDGGLSVRQTLDKGYIIAGETRSFGSGDWDVYLLKTDSLGDTLWTKVYGKKYDDKAHSVQQTDNGGYIICGYTVLTDSGDWNIWLLETDTDGDTVWVKSIGETGDEAGGGVHQTTDGGYIIAGYSNSFETAYDAIYVVKTDSLGEIVWTKIIGGNTSADHANTLQIVQEGGYIITGYSFSADGDSDVYLIRLAKPPGIGDETVTTVTYHHYSSTILSGPLILPEDKKCRVYDITGRTVVPNKLAPGIYFIEFDGQVEQKIVKIR